MPTRHGMTTSFRYEPPNPPNAQTVPIWNFPPTFRGSMRVRHPHTRSVRKGPRPTFRKFPSSCRVLLQNRSQRTFTFRTVSAGLSAGLSAKCPQDLAHTFRRISAQMRAESCCQSPCQPSTLAWASRKESATRTRCPGLTYAEIGKTKTWWTDARPYSHALVRQPQTFSTPGLTGGPHVRGYVVRKLKTVTVSPCRSGGEFQRDR